MSDHCHDSFDLDRYWNRQGAATIECDRCHEQFDEVTGGTNQVNSEELCWECVKLLVDETPDLCDCDLDDPCIHHQAFAAWEGEMFKIQRAKNRLPFGVPR